MLKKITAILAAMAILASFAACKNSDSETTTSANEESTTTDVSTTQASVETTAKTSVETTANEATTKKEFKFVKEKAQKLSTFNSDIFGKLTVYLQDDTLALFDEFDTMKFVLDAHGYNPTSVSTGVLLEAEDMDFDGHTDFRILYKLDESDGYFRCWLWNRNTKGFEYYTPLASISSPVFDEEFKSVTSRSRSSATTSKITVYEWQGGELNPVSNRTVEDATKPGAEIVDTAAEISDGYEIATIKLKGKANSSSRWLCKIEDESIVSLYSDTYDSTSSVYTFLFKGLKPGTTTVVFRFVPVWDADYVSEKIVNITVDSDLNQFIKEIQ